MKVSKAAAFIGGGIFLVAFLRNGTAGKLVRIGSQGAQVLTGGTAKVARKI